MFGLPAVLGALGILAGIGLGAAGGAWVGAISQWEAPEARRQ